MEICEIYGIFLHPMPQEKCQTVQKMEKRRAPIESRKLNLQRERKRSRGHSLQR
jgi:hypothetical protein